MNVSMECDIRLEMVERENSKGMPPRHNVLSRTCSLWALAEHDKAARKMWCNRNCYIIGRNPEWKFAVKSVTIDSRLRLFQFKLRESLCV